MAGGGAGSRRRARLAAARRAAGHSQESLAAELDVERTTVARWEQGRSTPLPSIRPRLAAAIKTTLVGLDRLLDVSVVEDERASGTSHDETVGDAGGLVLADVDTSSTLGIHPEEFVARTNVDVAVPDHVGESDVEIVRALTAALASGENAYGGGVVVQAGLGQLRWAAGLLGSRATSAVRRSLHEAVGNLAEVVGFTAFDMGDIAAAARCFRFALWCADQGSSWTLRACTLADIARAHAEVGEVDSALSAIEFAGVRHDRLPATAKAMLAVMHARYLALAGRQEEAFRELGVADEHFFSDRDPSADPPWLCYYDEAEHDGSVGRVLIPTAVRNKTPDLAVPRLEAAVRLQSPEYPRSRVFSQLRLATLLMSTGDPDEGASIGLNALLDATSIESRRLLREMERLDRVAKTHRGRHAVDDLQHQIRRRLRDSGVRHSPASAHGR
jgi:transcriptional regulator with XRE-family HTH domain